MLVLHFGLVKIGLLNLVLKISFFKEQKFMKSDMAYHLLGHIEVGYLLGGEDRSYE
jgi:hypothetical protein